MTESLVTEQLSHPASRSEMTAPSLVCETLHPASVITGRSETKRYPIIWAPEGQF